MSRKKRKTPSPDPTRLAAGRREKSLIVALCVVAALRVFVFSSAFPFFNNIDERSHVDLVLKYARGYWPRQPLERFDPESGRLVYLLGTFEYWELPAGASPRPVLWAKPAVPDRVLREAAGQWAERNIDYEAHSPPVYYAIAAAWYTLGAWLGLGDGQRLYWVRFLNVPLVALLVWCAYVFCRDWYPGRPELRLGVPLLLAFLPQDVFYAINSDVLSPLTFVVALLLLLTWRRRERPGPTLSAALGLAVALTFLVKLTNVALPVIFAATVALKTRQLLREGRGRDALPCVPVALFAAALPVALWFGRNYVLLGDATGTRAKIAVLGFSWRPLGALLAHPIFTPAGLWEFWDGLMRTLWRGELTWHIKPIASPMVDMFYTLSSTALLIAAAVALVVRARAVPVPRPDRVRADTDTMVWASVILSVACLAALSVSFEYPRSFFPSQQYPYFALGRLIAGALVPFLVLYVDGVAFLTQRFSRVVGPLVFVASTSLLMTVSEVMLTRHIFANPYNWFHLP